MYTSCKTFHRTILNIISILNRGLQPENGTAILRIWDAFCSEIVIANKGGAVTSSMTGT